MFESMSGFPGVFNLSLADFVEDEIADTNVVTGNSDTKKVLATVAVTIFEFFNTHPGCFVYLEGSSRSRNRLYRMAISINRLELSEVFDLFGVIENNWTAFEPWMDYEGFLIKRKKL